MGLFGSKYFNLEEKYELGRHPGGVSSLAVSKKIIATNDKQHHDIKIWNIQNGSKLNILKGHTNKVNAIAISCDDDKVASVSDDKTVKVWDLISSKEIISVKCKNAGQSIAFYPDGERLAIGEPDATISILNLSSGKSERILKVEPKVANKLLKKTIKEFKNITISSNGIYLAAITEGIGFPIIWRLDEDNSATILFSPPHLFYSLCFSSESNYLLGTGGIFSCNIYATGIEFTTISGFLYVYELSSGTSRKVTNDKVIFEKGAFSADGNKIIALASIPPDKDGLKKVLYSYPFKAIFGEKEGILQSPKGKADVGRGNFFSIGGFGPNGNPFTLEMQKHLFVWQVEY